MDELSEDVNEKTIERQLNEILENIRKYSLVLINSCKCDSNADIRQRFNECNTSFDALKLMKDLVKDKKEVIESNANIVLNSAKEDTIDENSAEQPSLAQVEVVEKSVPAKILEVIYVKSHEEIIDVLKSVNVFSDESLVTFVDLLYKKALSEPELSGQYVSACNSMSAFVTYLFADMTGENQTFREIFLSKCLDGMKRIRLRRNPGEGLNACAESDVKETLLEVERKALATTLTNTALFAHMYRQGYVRTYEVIKCVKDLLYVSSDESIECLTHLLDICGYHLEYESSFSKVFVEDFSICFVRLKEMVDLKEMKGSVLSPRVLQLVRDVIALRANQWIRVDSNDTNLLTNGRKE